MEAIVLAGGLGTRLRKVMPDVPKVMAPIAGKPFLEILIDSLVKKGFKRVILSLGYKGKEIWSYFKDRFPDIELIAEIEFKPLGTGGGLRLAMKRCLEDHVFIFNGDTFFDLEVLEAETLWKKSGLPIIIGCRVSDISRYGSLETDELNRRVLGFKEKGSRGPGIINAGCYVFPTNLLETFSTGESFSLEIDFLSHAVKNQHFVLFVSHGKFIDIGVPEDYFRAQQFLADIIQ